ncbi:MAG: hypothetical protein ACC628_10595 [Pirellulaceae bacterium]
MVASIWSGKWRSDLLTLGLWCGVFSLAAAGVLKVATGLGDGSPFTIWLGIAELSFLGLLYRVRGEQVRCALLCAVFTAFAAASAYHSRTNAESCGCLGFIRVGPFAMLLFDLFVALSACAALVRCWSRNTGFFEDATICVGRCVCAGLLVVSVASLVIAGDAARLAKQADTSLGVLGRWANDISSAFVFDLKDGDWDIVVLRQSCPTCKELLAQEDGKHGPRLVAIFVDDVLAFYAEELSGGSESVLAPIITNTGFDNVVTPSSMRMQNGKVVGFRSMVQTEGV